MLLEQFVPQEHCLKCDVCCRFLESHTIWAPLFTLAEIKHLVENDILPPAIFTEIKKSKKNNKTQSHRINLIKYKDYFICPCLNPLDHRCKIYNDRTFECQLYPFLLAKTNGKFYLAVDNKCPYFNTAGQDKIKNYTTYLEKEFRNNKLNSFLKQHPELFSEYPTSDLKLLFPIELS